MEIREWNRSLEKWKVGRQGKRGEKLFIFNELGILFFFFFSFFPSENVGITLASRLMVGPGQSRSLDRSTNSNDIVFNTRNARSAHLRRASATSASTLLVELIVRVICDIYSAVSVILAHDFIPVGRFSTKSVSGVEIIVQGRLLVHEERTTNLRVGRKILILIGTRTNRHTVI